MLKTFAKMYYIIYKKIVFTDRYIEVRRKK